MRGTELVHRTKEWLSTSSAADDNECIIAEPAALTRTMERSAWLRSLVVSLELSWQYQYEDDGLYRLLNTFTFASSLRQLHLSPAHVTFEFPSGLHVTSLGVRGTNLR